jgi:hypothetical protein
VSGGANEIKSTSLDGSGPDEGEVKIENEKRRLHYHPSCEACEDSTCGSNISTTDWLAITNPRGCRLRRMSTSRFWSTMMGSRVGGARELIG